MRVPSPQTCFSGDNKVEGEVVFKGWRIMFPSVMKEIWNQTLIKSPLIKGL